MLGKVANMYISTRLVISLIFLHCYITVMVSIQIILMTVYDKLLMHGGSETSNTTINAQPDNNLMTNLVIII